MSSRVFVIALDALSPVLLEDWVREGKAPVFARLMAKGAYGRLNKSLSYPHENSWSLFLYGASPDTTGQWGHFAFDAATYGFREFPSYQDWEHGPFFALDPGRRVILLDPPISKLVPGLRGLQVLGWGTEANQFLRASSPPALMADIIRRHGAHPAYSGLDAHSLSVDGAEEILRFRNPSIYDLPALLALERSMLEGIEKRTAIIQDLMDQPWDFFLASFAELHIVSHLLWHLECRHPLNEGRLPAGASGPLHRVFEAFERSLTEILARLAPDTAVVLFTPSGMKANASDMMLNLFLPEFLYRWHWGRAALAPGDFGAPLGPPAIHYRNHWKNELWALRTPWADRDLDAPGELEKSGDPLDWNPAAWYRPLWPKMKAFALPTYFQGMIRLNVRGREAGGTVAAEDFGVVGDELAAALSRLVCARSGRPIVSEVIRTRSDPFDATARSNPADLFVLWNDDVVVDAVESPDIGRIGPVPYFRTGGHAPAGFACLKGPGIPAGSALPEDAQVTDLSATLLALMGEPVPSFMEGRPFWPVLAN